VPQSAFLPAPYLIIFFASRKNTRLGQYVQVPGHKLVWEVVSIKKEVKVRIYVNIDGKMKPWDTLSEEEQKDKGTALNDTALRAAGYLPEHKTPKTAG
jgi:hypothetical protein